VIAAARLITRPDGCTTKNLRRTGAPNHLQGSGETSMVGTSDTSGLPCWSAALLNRDVLAAGLPGQGKTFVLRLELLVDEIAALRAERDELTEDLAWEMNAARTAAERAAGGEA